jgi:hypothetical protein
MIEAENYDLFVNDMERVTKFSRVTHTRDVFQVSPVLAEKSHQMRSGSVPETKDHALVYFLCACIPSDPPENREPFCGGCFNRRKVALFQIRPDSLPCRGKMDHMPLDVALHTER